MLHLPPETLALAHRLAAAHGVSIEDAVKAAIEQSALAAGVAGKAAKPRDTSPAAVAARRAGIDAFVHHLAQMPVLDCRTPGQIMDDVNAP